MKKLMSVILTAAVCASMAVTATAAAAANVEMRGATCDNCGSGNTYYSKEDYGKNVRYEDCYRGGHHKDTITEYLVKKGHICNNCGTDNRRIVVERTVRDCPHA